MKKFYITLGQTHVHSIEGKTIDKDCIVTIAAKNMIEAREKAFELLGPKWCFIYDEPRDMNFYPRGEIEIGIDHVGDWTVKADNYAQ